MEYQLTDYDKKLIAEADDFMKRQIARVDVWEMIGEESEKFDRRKFGKLSCTFCNHTFNPFYLKSLKEKNEWEWRWQGMDYKEPEKDYKCNCPKCKEELFFTIYIGQ